MTTKPDRIITTSIRAPESQLTRWRELYASTYPSHRLSFNLWLVAAIEKGIKS